MTSLIDWVRSNCRLLRAIAEDFVATQPFRELTIGTGIHLEPKTVALLLTLKSGGAKAVPVLVELIRQGRLNRESQ